MLLAHAEIAPGEGHAAGRQLLVQLYREATGQDLPPIAHTPLGKPYFPQSPWHFSITHTPRHVFCALSRKPVGIDAEELTRRVNPKLAEKILSPFEQAQYHQTADKPRALLTFWVLKEAQGKCAGQGLKIYPNHTRFSLEDPRVQEISGCLLAILEEEGEQDAI